MGGIKLFSLTDAQVKELPGSTAPLEKPLQRLFEMHLNTLIGVRFLRTEYSTGKTHGGRIDTLGIDENNCPTIVEYKRNGNENVINQGLFYLDWLLDHKAEFKWLVKDQIGEDIADLIDWPGTRLICIAGEFTKYDVHAVQQINRNIELIRYRKYEDLLLLELVNSTAADAAVEKQKPTLPKEKTTSGNEQPQSVPEAKYQTGVKTLDEQINAAPTSLLDLLDSLKNYILSLGDVSERALKYWISYRKLKNFASVWVISKSNEIVINLNLNPSDASCSGAFCRDVSNVGHWGSGDIEIRIKNHSDLQKAMPLIFKAYDKG